MHMKQLLGLLILLSASLMGQVGPINNPYQPPLTASYLPVTFGDHTVVTCVSGGTRGFLYDTGVYYACVSNAWSAISVGGGTGTVTSFSAGTMTWITVTNPTTTPTLSPTTGRTSHQVIGTCNATTTFAPCTLVADDLPAIPLTTGVTGVLPVANGGTNCSVASITCFNNITGFSAAGTTGTTSTNVVFSTSPTLVTPALGVATATSLAIGGATLSGMAFGVNGGAFANGNPSQTGTGNTSFGYQAGNALTVPGMGVTSAGDTLIGYQAGSHLTTARESTFIGFNAGSTATGNGAGTEDGINTCVGSQACSNLTTGGNTVAIGQKAGSSIITGTSNTVVGTHSAYSMSGSSNTVMGGGAGDTSATGSIAGDSNIFIGYAVAQAAGTQTNQVVIGTSAGHSITTAQDNVFVGEAAGTSNTTGSGNVYLGLGAGAGATGNSYNIAVGWNALSVGGGTNSVVTGYQSGKQIASGSNNTFYGYNTGANATTISSTVLFGSGAGFHLSASPSAIVFVGTNAGTNATTGNSNLCVGDGACNTLTTGSNNTIIGGWGADVSTGAASYQTTLGAGVTGSGNNTVTLGRSADTVTINGPTVHASYVRTTPILTSALASCAAGTSGARDAVSDATAPALGVVLTGGGTVFAMVHCSSTTNTWIVDGL